MPEHLLLAEGTDMVCPVYDVRGQGWAADQGPASAAPLRYVIVHHTVTEPPAQTIEAEVAHLRRIRDTGTYGLPYNFVVFPSGRIYYCNDVDRAWPHTYQFNGHTAIALVGNYDANPVPMRAIGRALRLADALAHVWLGQHDTVVQGHREMPGSATACPGQNVMALLQQWRRMG